MEPLNPGGFRSSSVVTPRSAASLASCSQRVGASASQRERVAVDTPSRRATSGRSCPTPPTLLPPSSRALRRRRTCAPIAFAHVSSTIEVTTALTCAIVSSTRSSCNGSIVRWFGGAPLRPRAGARPLAGSSAALGVRGADDGVAVAVAAFDFVAFVAFAAFDLEPAGADFVAFACRRAVVDLDVDAPEFRW